MTAQPVNEAVQFIHGGEQDGQFAHVFAATIAFVQLLMRTSTPAISRSTGCYSRQQTSQDFFLLAFGGLRKNLALRFQQNFPAWWTARFQFTVFK